MIQIRRSKERGHTEIGWLDSYHTFSFDQYYDPKHTHFRTLRVINEDRVAPAQGFGTHPHKDMEIITYVLAGALEHKDSMGNGSVMVSGDVQRMTAGTGVTHSEFNHSKAQPVHLLQIWIFPEKKNTKPGYEQKHFSPEQKAGRLCLVASREGREGSVSLGQDADLYASCLKSGEKLTVPLKKDRGYWLQVAKGVLSLQKEMLSAGDGVAVEGEPSLELVCRDDTEFLLFDLG